MMQFLVGCTNWLIQLAMGFCACVALLCLSYFLIKRAK